MVNCEWSMVNRDSPFTIDHSRFIACEGWKRDGKAGPVFNIGFHINSALEQSYYAFCKRKAQAKAFYLGGIGRAEKRLKDLFYFFFSNYIPLIHYFNENVVFMERQLNNRAIIGGIFAAVFNDIF